MQHDEAKESTLESGRMAVIAAELNESCLGAPLGMQAWVKWVERMWK